MSPRNASRLILGQFAIVLVSLSAGFLIGHAWERRELEARNNPESWNQHVAREFDRLVKPTPEQAARIQSQLDRAVEELQTIRNDTIGRTTNVIFRLVDQVEAELSPEQRASFARMKPKPEDLNLEVLKVSPPDKK